jgi:transcriptional regulator with XRE-family HTH domain
MTYKLAFPELREQATALRLAGKSLREIKQITGVANNRALTEALRGVPPQPWTRRPRAKDDLRAKARELRAKGYTYVEIAAELGVAKSSVSLWTRDMPRVGRISYEEIRERNAAGVSAFWAVESPRREARRRAVSDAAAAEIGALTDREVIIAGAVAYWSEGAKNKPYRRCDNEVQFINSDPQMILLFLRFLSVVGIERERVYGRVSIHESADIAGAQRFWQQVTELPAEQFRKPTLKRHNPKTIRKNTGHDYHGCLVIRVRKGCELYRQIEGWASAVMKSPTEQDADPPALLTACRVRTRTSIRCSQARARTSNASSKATSVAVTPPGKGRAQITSLP